MPLYIEKLTIDDIRNFAQEFNRIKFRNYTNYMDFLSMAVRGLQKIPNQSTSQSIKDVMRFYKGLKQKLH